MGPSFLVSFALIACILGQGMSGDGDASHAKDMVKIHALLADSTKVKRTTAQIPGGIVSKTTSNDPRIVKLIQEHTASMATRLKNGKPIREWDPLFASIFENHSKIHFEFTVIKNGVTVRETSTDSKVVELIRAHASAVSGFVREGLGGMHEEHAVPKVLRARSLRFLGRGDGIKTCPVTGEPVNKSLSAVIGNRTVYFCCPACIDIVKRDPASYLAPATKN